METFAQVVGRILRKARVDRGLTLDDVWVRSGGRFKPSSVGGYERGERSISLDRFCLLATFYATPADRMLAAVLEQVNPEGREQLVIDLNELSQLKSSDTEWVTQYVDDVLSERGDRVTDVVTLRSGDVEALGLIGGVNPPNLLERLKPNRDPRRGATSGSESG
jgi:transcriptional regulator with XRE-family HTH domain